MLLVEHAASSERGKPLAVCMPVEAHLSPQAQLRDPLRLIITQTHMSMLWVGDTLFLR
jgi:hypothetical protein